VKITQAKLYHEENFRAKTFAENC